jgi:hypothetical protein
MTVKPYDHERLGELLRLLRPAPRAWVSRAKRIPLGAPAEDDVAKLATKLEADVAFKAAFDADPVAAVEDAGLHELAAQLRLELDELNAAPEEWADNLPEVVAHSGAELPPAARLRFLLAGSGAVAQKLRS